MNPTFLSWGISLAATAGVVLRPGGCFSLIIVCSVAELFETDSRQVEGQMRHIAHCHLR